jgi:hypothetical protein
VIERSPRQAVGRSLSVVAAASILFPFGKRSETNRCSCRYELMQCLVIQLICERKPVSSANIFVLSNYPNRREELKEE